MRSDNKMKDTSRKKSPAKAFLWLLMIPAQLLIDVLLVVFGSSLDGMIFSGGPEDQGHGVPLFTAIMPIIGFIMTVVVIIAAVVLVIVRYSAIKKSNENRVMDQGQTG